VVSRANRLVAGRDLQPLPLGVTPHKLRHTFASILVAIGKIVGLRIDPPKSQEVCAYAYRLRNQTIGGSKSVAPPTTRPESRRSFGSPQMRGAEMRRSLAVIPVSALAAVVLAACGSSGNNSTVPSLGGGSTQQSAAPGSLAAARAAVACARKHGMPGAPDPVLGANGQVTFPGGAPNPTPEVRAACAGQIRAAEAASSTLPNVSAADMQALLRWAACMRAHGLPRWPDPNAQGVFHVKSADAGTLVTGNRAEAACRSLRGGTLAREDITPSGQ
jgi:hypothetical protein